MNLDDKTTGSTAGNDLDEDNVWKMTAIQPFTDPNEVEKLRKQCNSLRDENRRLQNALTNNQVPHVQVIDNVFLQTQVETLQWQLKQIEANRQMYRSLLEQVTRFLDRARKSLDILHEKNNPKDKNSASRVPRSRSVHAGHGDESPKSATPTSSSSSSSSRFTRAKSVTQISPSTTSYRDFTWSMLRKNDPTQCTPPSQDHKIDGIVYREPGQPELDPNDVPPEKLSEEAFRLMRTVQSLISMREPELARSSPTENGDSSPSPTDHHRHNDHHNDVSLSLQNSFTNSLSLQDSAGYTRRSCSDRGNESSSTDNDSRSSYVKSPNNVKRNLQNLFPGVRRSLDATSLNSGSSKTTEEEDVLAINNSFNVSIPDHEGIFTCTPSATPNRRIRKVEKKEKEKCSKSKPAVSVSSVEDESGFSSMSSFQEIGLPHGIHILPVRGCHTEVGLPEVPLDKGRHRRWSSTPAEIQAMINKQRNSFTASETAKESLSVWV
ncbi:cell wall protein RBR3-like isoform X2 [Ceratina calcarata]|nr:cell wall protein RBR3-like isoform X2 [Ceratina calcarata]